MPSKSTSFRAVHSMHYHSITGIKRFIFQENFTFLSKQSLTQSQLEYSFLKFFKIYQLIITLQHSESINRRVPAIVTIF